MQMNCQKVQQNAVQLLYYLSYYSTTVLLVHCSQLIRYMWFVRFNLLRVDLLSDRLVGNLCMA